MINFGSDGVFRWEILQKRYHIYDTAFLGSFQGQIARLTWKNNAPGHKIIKLVLDKALSVRYDFNVVLMVCTI
jgi:hypothetical protein